jgi:hypothetical protein
VCVEHYEPSLHRLGLRLRETMPWVDVKLALADVRDTDRLGRLIEQHAVDAIFAMAAYKHVYMGEQNCDQYVAVNVLATLARYYAARCHEAGLVPTVENVPPIAQMRESKVMTSPIGGPPEHLARLADQVDGLRFTVDTSHAQLFMNAATAPTTEPRIGRLCASMAAASSARTFEEFIAPLRGRIETAHVSDADGVFGEGLAYGEGSMLLDDAVDRLLGEARWIVTEILEPDPDRSPGMRDAWARIAARRERALVRA